MNSNAPLLELLLRLSATGLLITAVWAVLSWMWKSLVDRVKELETWRTNHETGHTEVLLKLRDLENEQRHTREVLEDLKSLVAGVAEAVNRRQGVVPLRPRESASPD